MKLLDLQEKFMHKKELVVQDTQVERPQYSLAEGLLIVREGVASIGDTNDIGTELIDALRGF